MNSSIFNYRIVKGSLPWFIGIWTIIILYLTLAPSETIPKSSIFDYDKFGHMAVFGGWTFLVGLFAITTANNIHYSMLRIALAGFLFGASIEIAQYLAPFNRTASFADAIANGIGCIIAYYVLIAIQRDILKNQS
jgi:VanZ family protein